MSVLAKELMSVYMSLIVDVCKLPQDTTLKTIPDHYKNQEQAICVARLNVCMGTEADTVEQLKMCTSRLLKDIKVVL